jgi:hypothetical protein
MPASSAYQIVCLCHWLIVSWYSVTLIAPLVLPSFVPTKIPRKRRLQMMVVAVWSMLLVMSCFVFLMLWYVLRFSNIWCITERHASKLHTSAMAVLGHVPHLDFLHRQEPSIRKQTCSMVPVLEGLAVFCRILPCVVSLALRVLIDTTVYVTI